MQSGPDQRSRGRFNPNRPAHQQPRGPQHNQTRSRHGAERVRGNAFQLYQRYLTLAQEAARNNDGIAAENYYQHAEHYFRVNNENRAGNSSGMSHQIDQDTAYSGFVADPGIILIDQAQPRTDDDQPWPTPDPNL